MITEWVMEEPIRRTPVPVRLQRQESSDRCIEIQPPGWNALSLLSHQTNKSSLNTWMPRGTPQEPRPNGTFVAGTRGVPLAKVPKVPNLAMALVGRNRMAFLALWKGIGEERSRRTATKICMPFSPMSPAHSYPLLISCGKSLLIASLDHMIRYCTNRSKG